MTAIVAFLVLFFTLLIFFAYLRFGELTPERMIPELKGATLLYNGEKETGYFTSYRYRIRAKPDFIYQRDNGHYRVVEYKSRQGAVKARDKVQLLATILAIQEETSNLIEAGYVLTKGGAYEKILPPPSTEKIAESLSPLITETRRIVSGIRPTPNPTIPQCRACGFRATCPDAKSTI